MLVLVRLLSSVMELTGTIGSAVIFVSTGVCLAHSGNDAIGAMSQSANGTTRLLRSKMRLLVQPGDQAQAVPEIDGLEDVVLTYHKQYHLLRVLCVEGEEVFLHVVLERPRANLAMTRHKVSEFEQEFFDDPIRVRLLQMRLLKEQQAAEREFSREMEVMEMTERETEQLEDFTDEEVEEIPAYLCEDSVRRMLGLSPISAA